jgi:hypothetical protein
MTLKKDNTSLIKGMIKEASYNTRPDGSWSFALNTLFGSWDGDSASITNEVGNEVCFTIPNEQNYTLIGAQFLQDDKFLLFFTDDVTTIIGEHDAIRCTFDILVKTNCLDLKRHRMLNTRHHIIAGCERIVNFTDGVGNYRSINIDRLEQYLALDNDGNPLFTTATANTGTNYQTAWNCVKFNHFPSFQPGCIDIDVITNSGGTIKAGSHQFVLRYLDESLNATNFSPASYPIFIYTEEVSSSSADGEATATITGKIINFKLTGLDPTFKFAQLGIMSAVGGTKSLTEFYILETIPIIVTGGVGNAEYTFVGIDPTKHTVSSLDELTVPNVALTGVKAHEIVDNRLLLGNISNTSEDYATMQRAWLNARVKWRMYSDYETDENNTIAQGDTLHASSNAKQIYINKTFMRDEIYALGGGFLLDDGTKTNAFHIPGRPADLEYVTNNDLTAIANANDRNNHNTRGNNAFVNAWDTRGLTITHDGNMQPGEENEKVAWSNVEHMLNDITGCTLNNEVASETTLTYTMNWAGTVGTFTLNLPNATDRALVKLSTNGLRFHRDQDTVVDSLTQAANTMTINRTAGTTTTILTIQIWYYNGVTQTMYHEIVGGTRTNQYNGASADIHLNKCKAVFPSGCTVPKWMVHNTFVVTGSNTDTTIEGYMGYHQSTTATYPTTTDCDGNNVYGTLAGTPIRHHRMPDCGGDASNFGFQDNDLGITKREWVDEDGVINGPTGTLSSRTKLNKLGLVIDVTDVYNNLPADVQNRIIGHYIYYGKRDEINKTVIDKGYAWRNQNRANFWHDVLDDTQAINGLGSQFWNVWWNFRREEGAIVGNPWFYDDFDMNPLGGGVKGRSTSDYFQGEDGFRASYAFGSSIPTQIGYGYYPRFTTQIGEPGNTGWHGTDENIVEFISPKTVFDKTISQGEYLKIECPISSYRNANLPDDQQEFRATQTAEFNYGTDIVLVRQNWLYTSTVTDFNHVATNVPLNGRLATGINTVLPTSMAVLGFHRKLNGIAIVPYNSSGTANNFTSPLLLHADAGGQVSTFVQTARPFPLTLSPSLTQPGDIMRGHASGDVDNTNTLWNDEFQSLYYTSIKNYKEVFTSLQDITYLHVNTCYVERTANSANTLLKGGDTFITKMRAVKTHSRKNGEGDKFASVKAVANAMTGFVESDDVNSSLAYANGTNSNYAPKSFAYYNYLSIQEDGFNYDTLWDGVDLSTNDAMNSNGYTFREFGFDYNPDFGKQLVETPVFPLSDTYNYCDNCVNREPNAIYYSDKGYSSDTNNKFKLIAANNKFLIPSESGEITNLFLEKDQLYAHTDKALFAVQTRPQQLNSDNSTIFVGTGEIGSIPPKRLISVQHGYAGSRDPFATIGTQYGTFFVDENSGRIFLFGKGLNEISKRGMEQWFKRNVPLQLNEAYYKVSNGINYPMRNVSHQNGIGFQAAWDNRLNRIILHKSDYRIRETDDAGAAINFTSANIVDTLPAIGVANTLYALVDNDSSTVKWNVWLAGAWEEISLQDADWFENWSWTASYSMDGQFWVSFHSYQPNYMFYDAKNLFTFINGANNTDTQVWKHSERNFQNYYGTKYDHVIEWSHSSGGAEKIYNNVQLQTEAWLFNDLADRYNKIENITFDHFYAYNTKQSSQKRELIVKQPNQYQNVTLPLNQTLMDRTDNYWRFNRFRDEVVDYTRPHLTKEWLRRKDNYNTLGQGYIDKVIDPVAITGNKNIYQLARLRDKVFNVRMFFKPTGDYKIRTNLTSFLTNISRR